MLSLYTGELREEEADRFHANIAFAREVFDATGGWPLNKRGDFDQAFLKRLAGVTTTVDPRHNHPSSYIFRWGPTAEYHGQGVMQGPSDVDWYERVSGVGQIVVTDAITPAFDSETIRVLNIPQYDGINKENSIQRNC